MSDEQQRKEYNAKLEQALKDNEDAYTGEKQYEHTNSLMNGQAFKPPGDISSV